MISSPLLNGGAGPKLIKEKNDVHFNTEFNTKSKTLKSCSKVLKFGQMIKKVTRNNNLRSCENKRTFHNMIINIYLQFLFCIQSSGSIFRHRSGKHFEREIYTTNLDLQKKRYLNYLNENQIMNVWCGMTKEWWLGRKLILVKRGFCGVWLSHLSKEMFLAVTSQFTHLEKFSSSLFVIRVNHFHPNHLCCFLVFLLSLWCFFYLSKVLFLG